MREDPFGGGLVDLLVLSAIGRGESYGYAIAQRLAGPRRDRAQRSERVRKPAAAGGPGPPRITSGAGGQRQGTPLLRAHARWRCASRARPGELGGDQRRSAAGAGRRGRGDETMSDRTEQLGECEAWYVAEVTGHVRSCPSGALDAVGGAAGQPLRAAAVGEPRRAARCARIAGRLRRPTPPRRGAAGRGASAEAALVAPARRARAGGRRGRPRRLVRLALVDG